MISNDTAVYVDKVSKSFLTGKTSVPALDSVSLSVNRGELFGIIGPDGAGKTTLFRILTTLMLADSGVAQVDGLDTRNQLKEIRKRVGYMPGKFSLYQDLTVEENLSFFATLFNTTIEENYDLVKDIYRQIEKFKKRRAGALSGGMKQKLALSCALIHRPAVLFLDEPTTGVDSVSRTEFWELLRNLQKEKITIVVSTPYMDEAGLCDRVALIQKGKILAVDTPDKLTALFNRPLFAVRSSRMYELLQDISRLNLAVSCYPFGQYHHVVWQEGITADEATGKLKNLGHTDVESSRITPNIEDCFMDLMTRDIGRINHATK